MEDKATIKMPDNCFHCPYAWINYQCRLSHHDIRDNKDFYSTKPMQKPDWCPLIADKNEN